MMINEMPVPELKHQQRPNLLGSVCPPLLVLIDDPGYGAGVQIAAASGIRSKEIFSCELPQRPAEPRGNGNGKALLWAVDNGVGQDAAHGPAQERFSALSAEL